MEHTIRKAKILAEGLMLLGLSSCAPSGLSDCPVFDSEPLVKEFWELGGIDDTRIEQLKTISKANDLIYYYRHDDSFMPARISDMDRLYRYQGILMCNNNMWISIMNDVAATQFLVTVQVSDPRYEARAKEVFIKIRKVIQPAS